MKDSLAFGGNTEFESVIAFSEGRVLIINRKGYLQILEVNEQLYMEKLWSTGFKQYFEFGTPDTCAIITK